MQITQFFLKGLNKTLKLINGTNFSYAGPWTTVYSTGTVIDSWYVGDFMTADYTLSVDQGSDSKEIIKCLVAGSPQTATVTIYGRTNLGSNIINITATVDNSRVSLVARTIVGECKVIYSAAYYQTLSTPIPALSSIIPVVPTYAISPNVSAVAEGGTVTYTVTTTNVINNTTLYWVNSGSSVSADFNDNINSGTVTIVNNFGIISRTLVNDLQTEGSENIILEIKIGNNLGPTIAVSTPTTITDTSIDPTLPVYSVSPSTLTMNEGASVTFTVTTANVANGTTLYWNNDGTTNGATDFASPGSNNGTVIINEGTGTIVITLVDDFLTEGAENIAVKIRTGSVIGPIVATAFTVTVLDTSVPLTQSYSVSPNLDSILEGNSVNYTVTTTNVPDATELYWSNSGTTVAIDFLDSANAGSFTIINNEGTVTRTLRNDLLTDGTETIIINVRTLSTNGTIVATAIPVNVIDSSTGVSSAAYAISPSANFVNEGATINYTITTANVANGTTLYWTNSGTTVDVDFVDNSNNGFVGITNNTGLITRVLKNDTLTEGSQTVVLQLRTDSITGSVVATASSVIVADTSTTPQPTYALAPASNSVNEGSALVFTVTTTNVPNATDLYWTATNASDFTISNGSVTVTNNTGTFEVTPTADTTTEGAETFTVALRTVSISGDVVANSSTVTINDTSEGPPAPTYSVVPAASSVNEGSALNFTVTTSLVSNGTTLYWTATNAGDFATSSGSFTITTNEGTFSVTPAADTTTEGAESFSVLIRTVSVSGAVVATSSSVVINDTSLNPPVATYAVASTAGSINEGSSIGFNVTTTLVSDGTLLYYSLSNAGDFATSTGTFTINSNAGSFSVTPTADTTTEGSETFAASVRTGSVGGPIVATSASVTINDTSQGAVFTADYAITVTNAGNGYLLTGSDRNGSFTNAAQPPLVFTSGDKVQFNVNPSTSSAHPFYIKTQQSTGTVNQVPGVNGQGTTTLQWTTSTPGTYGYQCSIHFGMWNTITIQ